MYNNTVKTISINEDYTPLKGKIAIFIMTFSGDVHCLKQCLVGIEEQIKNGYDIEIFILDDANSPIDDEYIIQNYNYYKTFFKRNGNLRGTECSHGILIEMLKIARKTRAEYIMKVDSDMYIRSLDRFLSPLKQNEKSIIGFKLSQEMDYCAGVIYIVHYSGLYNSIKNFYKWIKLEKENNKNYRESCPEDWAITRCVASLNDFPMIQWDNATNPEHWLMSPFNFKEINKDGSVSALSFSRYQLYDFVNFGNRHELTCSNPRKKAGEVMESFVKFDLNNEFISG